MKTAFASFTGTLSVATLLALASPVWAQPGMGMGGSGMPPPSSPSGRSKPKPVASDQPQTHAASGADETSPLQTQEPSLPQEPLTIPPEVARRIGTGLPPETRPSDAATKRHYYGLWYSEESKDRSFRTVFPLWAEWKKREEQDRASLYGLFYFNRRSPKHDADVLFPLFWRMRDDKTVTTAVGPYIHQETPALGKKPATHFNWLPPILFEGQTETKSYFIMPPLLTYMQHTSRDGLNIVGPMFCKWKGGPACDARTADDIDLGIAPLYFYGRNESTEYELIPPLLHYYRYREAGDSYLNIWGPYIRSHDKEGDSRNLFPFYFHNWGKNKESLTVFPFFHYGYDGNSARLATPLFYWSRGENNEKTFATWGYAHYKGRTELEMITPLYWHYRDPDIGLDRKFILPFAYTSDSPRGKDLAIFPFYAHFQRYGLSDETWVTPLFRYQKNTTGWEANLFPFFHIGQSGQSTHLVLAPFVWDFASPTSRSTVVLPGFFRFADQDGVSQLALNTYYSEKKVPGGSEWEFHFFPLFSYGQSPTGHWWNILYGMAGYSREGAMSKMRLAYIPITLSNKE